MSDAPRPYLDYCGLTAAELGLSVNARLIIPEYRASLCVTSTPRRKPLAPKSFEAPYI